MNTANKSRGTFALPFRRSWNGCVKKASWSAKRPDGIFQYSSRLPKEELLLSLRSDFVARALGGSLSPFMAYLAHEAKRNEAELRGDFN
jgi:hypothetical protein